MQIFMQLPYGLALRLQKTVATLPLIKFLSVVQLTLLYHAAPFMEVLFQLWVIFTHSAKTTARIFLSLLAVVFTELLVLVVVITLAQKKMSLLL